MEFSVVIPIYKDGYLAGDCCEALHDVFVKILDTPSLESHLEIIFVNDGSPDNSLEQLVDVRKRYPFVKVINLSRNFGQHPAIACGMRAAKGKYVLRMNVDMQDHPSEIPKLLEAIQSGNYDLVVGQYKHRSSKLFVKFTSYLYFFLFKFLTGLSVPQNTSPLRIMNRKFVDAYNGLTEKSRLPQGLDHWLGFRHCYIDITHHPRADKKSAYTFESRFSLALSGILYFSDRPLTLVALAGFWAALIGIAIGAVIIVTKLTGSSDLLPGYASLASISLIGFGIHIGLLGLLGLYIGRIFREAQNRPLYIVQDYFD